MKAILVNDDRSLRWDDVPDPICGDEDCLVKIEAAALNRADLMQREGDYPPPPGCPEWMGLEIAGTIVKVGTEAAKKSLENMIKDNPAWSTLEAIKEGRLHIMDKRLFNLKPNARWAESYGVLYEKLTEK